MFNCKWVFSLVVYFVGDNVICGSYDSKLVWFDLDFFIKLYRMLRYYKKVLWVVVFYFWYLFFVLGLDDGSVIVCYGMVYNDFLQNFLLVFVKVLKGYVLI